MSIASVTSDRMASFLVLIDSDHFSDITGKGSAHEIPRLHRVDSSLTHQRKFIIYKSNCDTILVE